MGDRTLWDRFKGRLYVVESVGISVDLSRMSFDDQFFVDRDSDVRTALAAMEALEAGAIANPDEQRMVGHYWLRNPDIAPTPQIAREIRACLAGIKAFARRVHAGRVRPQKHLRRRLGRVPEQDARRPHGPRTAR